MPKKDTELLSWVLRGSQRRTIIKVMEGNKIPAQIFEESHKLNDKISRNSVSDVLKEFREKGIAECVNPKAVKGRIYRLTKKGRDILKNLL